MILPHAALTYKRGECGLSAGAARKKGRGAETTEGGGRGSRTIQLVLLVFTRDWCRSAVQELMEERRVARELREIEDPEPSTPKASPSATLCSARCCHTWQERHRREQATQRAETLKDVPKHTMGGWDGCQVISRRSRSRQGQAN